MHPLSILAAAVLATASVTAHADSLIAALDLSTGNTSFGRNNAVGSFVDTFSFSFVGSSYFLTGTASSARSGTQDLDFTSLVILNSSDAVVASFQGNLGNDANEFYSLPEILMPAGSYRLVVTGVNSLTQASYSGNVAVTASPVPEPGTVPLVLAGLGTFAFLLHRRKA